MLNKLKLSIVMAVYNGEKYILKQLDSIRNQSRVADEVIIIDDCSKDSTPELVEKYILNHKLKNWQFYRKTENRGYKRTFYNALSKATGDYVFLCDQDDVWHLDKIEIMEKLLLEHPQIKTLNTAVTYIDSNDNEIPINNKLFFSNNNLVKFYVGKYQIKKVPLNEIFVRNITTGCAMCASKDIVDSFLKAYDFGLPHDWFMNILASLKNNGVYYYNTALINYRLHDNNTIGISDNKTLISDINGNGKMELFEQQILLVNSIYKAKYINENIKNKIIDVINMRKKFYMEGNIQTFLKLFGKIRDYMYIYNYRQVLIDIRKLLKSKLN